MRAAAADYRLVDGRVVGALVNGRRGITLEEAEALLAAPAWHADAACKEHPELPWIPSLGVSPTQVRAMRQVCAGCLVREECFEFSMASSFICGIWAGTSDRDRRELRRLRR